jgi:hypothetical protein
LEYYIWRPDARAGSTGEDQYFWRFTLRGFLSGDLASAVDEALTQQGCRSYRLLETFGSWDALLELWLPRTTAPEKFLTEMLLALDRFGPERAEYMEVKRVLRHHAWPTLPPTALDAGAAELEVDRATITVIERVNERVHDVLLHRATGADSAPPPDFLDAGPAPGRAGLFVAPAELDHRGIRFVITFTHPRKPLQPNQTRDLDRRLLRACNSVAQRAADQWDDEPTVSVYSGFGTLSTHVITAQAPDQHFYAFSRMLLQEIYDDGMLETYEGLKPVTTICAAREALVLRESLIEPTPVFTEGDLAGFIEDERRELKSSVWLNARHLLETGEYTQFPEGPDKLAQAVCGMLNRDGGLIVVGLAEAAKLPTNREAPLDRSRFDVLGIPLAANGDLAVLGLEAEFRNDRARVRDYDQWVLRATDAIAKRIKPDPFQLFCVQFRPLRLSADYGGRTLGLVHVSPPRDRNKWFYVGDGQFFVRHQGRTITLRGEAMDSYKQASQKAHGR